MLFTFKHIGVGLFIAVICYRLLSYPLTAPAAFTAAIVFFMVYLWISSATPYWLTACLPMFIFAPTGILSVQQVWNGYFHKVALLFLGGFLIARSIQKWDLHKRIALNIIQKLGSDIRTIVLSFMIASAFTSMFLTNTATTMMMLPIGLSIIGYLRDHSGEGITSQQQALLLLSIAYSSSLGGMATLNGTVPNGLTSAFLAEKFSLKLDYLEWFILCFPFVLTALPLSYLVLTRIAFNTSSRIAHNITQHISKELSTLGPLSMTEKKVLAIACMTILAWLFQPFIRLIYPSINDALIAIIGGGLLFFVPARNNSRLLEWSDLPKIPWGIIILIGGGLTLAAAVQSSGLAAAMAQFVLSYPKACFSLILFLIVLSIISMSELTSNTATATVFVPIVSLVSMELELSPVLLAVPATLAASCAFMLPVATPPNAIVYGSGRIPIATMVRAGLYLNILFTVLLTIYGLLLHHWKLDSVALLFS